MEERIIDGVLHDSEGAPFTAKQLTARLVNNESEVVLARSLLQQVYDNMAVHTMDHVEKNLYMEISTFLKATDTGGS